MRALVLLCATIAAMLLMSSVAANSQNLVPNPSFETYSATPNYCSTPSAYAINLATPWIATSDGTSDYINRTHSCSWQPWSCYYGHTGDACAGVDHDALSGVPYHEFIQAPLDAPLTIGQKYSVSFYVVKCTGQASGTIGAMFSVGGVDPVFGHSPDVSQSISSIGGWVKVSAYITPSIAYDTITLGVFSGGTTNFHDNNYYLIDDVDVHSCGTAEITQEPVDGADVPNGTMTLTVGVSSPGDVVSYQWQRVNPNPTDIPEGGVYTGTMTNTLTIHAGNDYCAAGYYQCVVTFPCVTLTTRQAYLSCPPPVIASQSADTTVYAGTQAVLTVVPATPELPCQGPYTYFWNDETRHISLAEPHTNQLVFDPVQVSNAGRYSCVVQDSCGETFSLQESLTVLPRPQFHAGTDACCRLAPQYTDPGYSGFTGAIAIVTREPQVGSGNVAVEICDLEHSVPAEGTNWAPLARYSGPGGTAWNKDSLGTVFGETVDEYGNIFVAHSSCYASEARGQVAGAGPGAVYRIDGVTGVISVFALLPNPLSTVFNRYPGLGNISYDCQHHQFFVSDLADGKIYRLRSGIARNGSPASIQSTFELGPPYLGPPGFAPLGKRIWAVQWHNNRVYFGVWGQDVSAYAGPNQVWSVGLASSGAFDASSVYPEVTLPNAVNSGFSMPASDISFSSSGRMMVAQRGISEAGGVMAPYPYSARVLEYVYDDALNYWSPSSNTFTVGCVGNLTNASGGVDYDREVYDGPPGGAGSRGRAWATGDGLHQSCPAPFTDVIYGVQGLEPGGGGVASSLLIDADGAVSALEPGRIGDVRVPCVASVSIASLDTIQVKPANWLHDAFPFNETPGLPGTVWFDTTSALIVTGFNTAQLTGAANRFDIPGDSALVYAPGANVRVDMVFRILPGPGNYHTLGNRTSGLRPVPTDQNSIVTAGGPSFWGQYLANPGSFASPGAHFGGTQWDPNSWNSARCDTADVLIWPVSGNPAVFSTLAAYAAQPQWMACYHEADPHYATLGISKHLCFLTNPAGAAGTPNITCSGAVPGAYGAASGYAPGLELTKEGTKIIPDGLLTPGSHVEYFFRKSNVANPQAFTMVPDTMLVTPQLNEGSTDAHRWQELSVLPDRWKNPAYGGDGLACMLFVDLDDGHGDEAAWVSVADSIGATKNSKRGAHNGWRARGDEHLTDASGHPLHVSVDPNIAVYTHGGQPGTLWDMYGVRGVRDPVNGFAGSLGGRLAPAPTGYALNKGARIGPTPEMLNLYPMLFILTGDVGDRILGPANDRGQNEITLLENWMTGVTNRAIYIAGDDFVESESSLLLPPSHLTFLSSFLGVSMRAGSYRTFDCDPNDYADLKTAGPLASVGSFTLGIDLLWGCDLLNIAAVGPVGSGNYPSGSWDCQTAPFLSGVYNSTLSPKVISYVDGWDIQHLFSGSSTTGDVTSRGRLGYFWGLLTNLQSFVGCNLVGTPSITTGVSGGDVPRNDFLTIRNTPMVTGPAVVRFGLTRSDRVHVAIYDVAGRRVRLLADRFFEAGTHDLRWEGADDHGVLLPRGVYFAQLHAFNNRFSQARRIVFLR